MPENTTSTIIARISAEPESKQVLYEILSFCIDGRTMEDLKAHLPKITDNSVLLHSHTTYVSWLLDIKALEKEESGRICTTADGAAVVAAIHPDKRVRTLMEEQAQHKDIFLRTMRACAEPKSKGELEDMLDGVFESTGYYASYFVAELENAGAIAWAGKWETTNSGLGILLDPRLHDQDIGGQNA